MNKLCLFRPYRLLSRIGAVYRIACIACILVDTALLEDVSDTAIRRYSQSVCLNEIGALDLVDIALKGHQIKHELDILSHHSFHWLSSSG